MLPRPEGPPKHPTLSTALDCRREMSKVYRLARHGTLALEDASRLTFMLSSIAKIVETADLEARLKALETAPR